MNACLFCGRHVDASAITCPGCGRNPREEPVMSVKLTGRIDPNFFARMLLAHRLVEPVRAGAR